MTRTSRRALGPATAFLALALTACGGANGSDGVSGTVLVDGSSTVEPMSNAAKELLTEESPGVRISVGAAGTGGGFERFCAGETDISDASRPIEQEEIDACAAHGVEWTELQVATDALTVVVHPDLGVDCLTVDQLVALWEPGSEIDNWRDLDPAFPDQEIALFGPGTDSGTYDYLAGDVLGTDATREDYEASEDDNVLVQGVANTPGATAYFGFTYFEENADSLKALSIDNGAGCVRPSAETAQAGEYAPLSRPLFLYVNDAKYADNEAVRAYVDFYVEQLSTIAEAARFIPLSEELYAGTQRRLEDLG